MEGDVGKMLVRKIVNGISIHSLRMEGDIPQSKLEDSDD